MSQPFDSNYRLPALREVDQDRGEFWVSSPWLFSSSGENLSAYERNGVHLNLGDGQFGDMSFLTGADSPGDGRTVVACDITDDGMPELLVRQVGGGSLIVYENQFPKANWLRVSLRGTESNRSGIGAKVVCEMGDRRIARELYPVINFHSQAPASLHFGLGPKGLGPTGLGPTGLGPTGLGTAEKIDRLTITWPSGRKQELTDLPINSHLLIHESGVEPPFSKITPPVN